MVSKFRKLLLVLLFILIIEILLIIIEVQSEKAISSVKKYNHRDEITAVIDVKSKVLSAVQDGSILKYNAAAADHPSIPHPLLIFGYPGFSVEISSPYNYLIPLYFNIKPLAVINSINSTFVIKLQSI